MFVTSNIPSDSIHNSSLTAICSENSLISHVPTISDLTDPFASTLSNRAVPFAKNKEIFPLPLSFENKKRAAYLSSFDLFSFKRKLQPDNFYEDNNLFADTDSSIDCFDSFFSDSYPKKQKINNSFNYKTSLEFSPSGLSPFRFSSLSDPGSVMASPTALLKSKTTLTKRNYNFDLPKSPSSAKFIEPSTFESKHSNSEICLSSKFLESKSSVLSSEHPFEYVDPSIVKDLLSDSLPKKFDKHYILDCRFPYEYKGGHISGAINVSNFEVLENLFFKNPPEGNILLVFHCEFSIKRAPSVARFFRKRDRELNHGRYPHLNYPTIYVVRGGYNCFFSKYNNLCNPSQYVKMDDTKHKTDCTLHFTNFEKQFKRTKSATISSSSLVLYSPSSYLSKSSKSHSHKY
ncbi:hypothetical protein BB561_004208 [Smittium simulii]|uniref:M-phase inducer phosphatase n=1 Tax=Smittium simulii TaxID=133385 RepID=A0A2T9YHF9_9FUNG|nr:hypothetical protein BB561_004208 [Smittium simulii]